MQNSRVVYSTDSKSANLRKTGRAGMLRVAAAAGATSSTDDSQTEEGE